MNEYVAVRIRGDGSDGEPAGTQVVLFQSTESDLTSPRGGPARVKDLAQSGGPPNDKNGPGRRCPASAEGSLGETKTGSSRVDPRPLPATCRGSATSLNRSRVGRLRLAVVSEVPNVFVSRGKDAQ